MYTSPVTDVLAWEKIPSRLRRTWSNQTRAALAAYPEDWPEVEYISISALLGAQVDSRHADPEDGANYASLAVALVAPQSRGSVTIASADAAVAPVINPNYLTAQADVDVAVAGFRRVREFYGTDALRSFVLGDEYYPGLNVSTASDAQIEQFVRGAFNTIWHGSSTCAMGPVEDEMTVVDAQARVVGVEGLRVVDASAFPLLPPGHPMSLVCESLPVRPFQWSCFTFIPADGMRTAQVQCTCG